MLYEGQVTVREPSHIKLLNQEYIKRDQSYNVFLRVSEKIELYDESSYSLLGYIDLDGLKVQGVKQWDSEKVKSQPQLQSKTSPVSSDNSKKTNKSIKETNRHQADSPPDHQQMSKQAIKQQNQKYQDTYNFVVYRDGQKESEDVMILDIHTRSRGLKTVLEKIATYSHKKSSNPLSLQLNKQFNISLMSGQNPQQRYRGFVNLAMILLIVLNFRNIVANLEKYGIQEWPALNMKSHTYLFLTFGLGIHIIIGYIIIRLQFQRYISTPFVAVAHTLNILCLLISNFAYTKYFDPGVFGSNLLTMAASVITLKLISYAHFNSNVVYIAGLLRNSPDSPEIQEIDEFVKGEIKKHLANIVEIATVQRLAYFIVAPTLCYQLEYPRNTSIRKGWLAKRVGEYLISTLVMNILAVQYLLPYLNSIGEYYLNEEFRVAEFAYRIIELSVPMMIFWVLMFYSFFHLLLNILGELTRFGDRCFYLDWWNCKDHDEYWRKWNIPVHNWMLRHLYIPLTGAGVSKQVAGFASFFVSALYHQYWIGVPLQILSCWAFLAIMLQAPLIALQKYTEKKMRIHNTQMGNVVFWISFCFVGQPLVAFAYYYLYLTKQ